MQTMAADDVVEWSIALLREIAKRHPDVLRDCDVESFINDQLQPTLVDMRAASVGGAILPSNGAIAHTYAKLKACLEELVRLYDWRNELGRIERDFNHDRKQMKTWLNQYGREKKAAWNIARNALGLAPDIDVLLLHERIQQEAQERSSTSASAPLRLMSQCARHQGLPITIRAMAHAAVFYCPHCEEEGRKQAQP